MEIRRSTAADTPEILRVYAAARAFMRQSGNPTQWGDKYPAPETVKGDIQNGNSYVVLDGERICGAFVFFIGTEPTYAQIDGAWPEEEPSYGVIHRVASDGTVRGVMQACLAYCGARHPVLRIDTHRDNRVMQHLLEKYGFSYCGIIHIEDGTPRLAYHRGKHAPDGKISKMY